jgi:hypothetical protein
MSTITLEYDRTVVAFEAGAAAAVLESPTSPVTVEGDDGSVTVEIPSGPAAIECAASPVSQEATTAQVSLVVDQGPPGPAGTSGASDLTYLAVVSVSGHRVVLYDPAAPGWIYADRTIPAHAGAQLAVTVGAIVAGASGDGRISGVMDEPSWSWPAPCPLYLDADGYLTATAPTAGFLREVARAITSTRIVIEPEPAIILA